MYVIAECIALVSQSSIYILKVIIAAEEQQAGLQDW